MGGSDEALSGLYGRETMQRPLAIDFDGVLHSYRQGWKGHDIIPDPPVEGAVQACEDLLDAGWRLYVLTSRAVLEPVVEWLDRHHFPDMEVTRVKPIAVAYIDDRAVRFSNWQDVRKKFA